MKTQINYSRNKRYFRPSKLPRKAILPITIVAAVTLLFAFIAQTIVFAVPAIVVIVFIACSVLARPSDAEIDAQMDAVASGLREEALAQLGLDGEEVQIAQPLFLKGYSLGRSQLHDSESGGFLIKGIVNAVRDVVGKDGYWRSPECVVTAWFFTEDLILQYSKVVSLIAPTFKGRTNECAYKDVVSLRTELFERPAIDPKTGKVRNGKTARSMAFAILNAGGEALWCCSKDVQDAQESVSSMRSLLRQKKISS